MSPTPAGRRPVALAAPAALLALTLPLLAAGAPPAPPPAAPATGAPAAPAAPPAPPEAAAVTPQAVAEWDHELKNLGDHCKALIEEGMGPDCEKLLAQFEAKLPKEEHPDVTRLRALLEVRRTLLREIPKVPPLTAAKPEVHWEALFKVYAAIPEAYFPYDEVRPAWQTWLLSDDAQARFKRYKVVRVLARSTDREDTSLEALFFQRIEQPFHDYGFHLVDLSTTAPQGQKETVVKLNLTGKSLDVADAKIGQVSYELTGEVTSIRYTDPTAPRLPARTWTVVETAPDLESARDAALGRLAPQVSDAVFYLTLTQLFPAG